MVEEIFKTERHAKPLIAPAKKPFFFYYNIFLLKNQIKVRQFDIFYYFCYNYNGKEYCGHGPQIKNKKGVLCTPFLNSKNSFLHLAL